MQLRPLRSGLLVVGAFVALGLLGCDRQNTPETLLASGKESLSKKEFKSAVVQFKAALQADPKGTEARFMLAQALLAAGDPESAASELVRTLEQKHDAELVMPILARALVQSGQHKKLVNLFGDAKLNDKAALASYKTSVATAWLALSDKSKAETALAAAFSAMPEYVPAMLMKARMMAGSRDVDGAKALVEKALAADPKAHEAWQLMGELAIFFRRDAGAGAEAFRKALALEPSFIPAQLSLISALIANQDLPAAKAQAEKLRAIQPGHPQTLFVEAQIAYAEKNLLRARELTQQLMRFGSNHVGVLQMSGAVEAQVGSLVVAESRFTKALQIEPNLPVARRNLALVYLRLGQAQRALDTVQPLLTPSLSYSDAHAVAGDAYLRLGNPSAAQAAFARAIEYDPGNDRIQTAIALTQLSKGDPDSAFAQLDALSLKSKDTYADSALVSARLHRREHAAALAAVELMAKKQPGDPTVAELRGRIHLDRRDYESARKAFDEALKLDPNMFAAIASLATIDSIEGKTAQARARFEAAVKADARNHHARMALADMMLRAGAPLDEIKALLREAILASPGESGPRLQLIDLAMKKRQYKEALSVAQEAAAAMPTDIAVLDAVGRAQAESGDTEQAISTFRRIAAIEQSSGKAYLRLADVYKTSGKKAAAETALRKAIEVDPELVQAKDALLDLLLSSNRAKDAMELARQMQQRRPKEPDGYAFEALIHNKLKAPDAAFAAYRKGLAVPGSSPDLARLLYVSLLKAQRNAEADRFAEAWFKDHPDDVAFDYQMSVTALTRLEMANAETRLRRIVTKRPNHPMALNNLAWVLAYQNKPGGIDYAQRAVNLAPDRPALMDTLAMALAQDKQYAKALDWQQRAVALATEDKGLRLNLAKIALQAGEKTLAKAELEALKTVGPSLPYYEEVNRLLKSI